METTITETKPNFTISVAVDYKSAAILGIVLFVAVLGALIIYKKI